MFKIFEYEPGCEEDMNQIGIEIKQLHDLVRETPMGEFLFQELPAVMRFLANPAGAIPGDIRLIENRLDVTVRVFPQSNGTLPDIP